MQSVDRGGAIYGVNTGFGSFSRKRISGADLEAMQRNLIRSHAAGVGPPLPDDVVRATMLLLAASLCRGNSGVRPFVAEAITDALSRGVVPVIPETGSVGASGDLAPLAHIALVLIGEGQARYDGKSVPGAEALRRAGIEPLVLGAKEGLALINGTHLMAAQASLLLADVDRLFDAALCAAAMSIDACKGTDSFLDERVHDIRRQSGPQRVASRLRNLLVGSEIIASHKVDDPRVQDPYSLRCIPQVLGASLDAIDYVRRIVECELGAVTDNPLVFPPDPGSASQTGSDTADVISAGNFHGLPLALPLDQLGLAIGHIAGISERRVFFLLAATDSENPINPHLSPVPGLHSGLMITQYTAAACCNEIIGLCTPASIANIPTSAGIEDYNSFGPRSAAKARRILDLTTQVVSIEMLCAGEAIEYHRPLQSGSGVERAHATLRSAVPRLVADRPPSPDIRAIAELIQQGRFGD